MSVSVTLAGATLKGPPGVSLAGPHSQTRRSPACRTCLRDVRSTSATLPRLLLNPHVHRTAPRRAGSHRSAPLRLSAARNKNLGEGGGGGRKKISMQHDKPCLSPAVKHLHKVTLTPLHARPPLIMQSSTEEEKKTRRPAK